jgi:hypothetical protein
MSSALIGSIEHTETVLRRLLFQRAGFYSNTFTWHFFMDPNACLCYPNQPGVIQTFPQVLLNVQHFLSRWGRCSCAPRDLHSHFQCMSSFAVCRWHPVVVRWRGHVHKQWLPLHLSLGIDSDSAVSGGWGSERGLGFQPSLYTWWWPNPSCYQHCHFRFSFFAYRPPP